MSCYGTTVCSEQTNLYIKALVSPSEGTLHFPSGSPLRHLRPPPNCFETVLECTDVTNNMFFPCSYIPNSVFPFQFVHSESPWILSFLKAYPCPLPSLSSHLPHPLLFNKLLTLEKPDFILVIFIAPALGLPHLGLIVHSLQNGLKVDSHWPDLGHSYVKHCRALKLIWEGNLGSLELHM